MSAFAPLPRLVRAKRSRFPDELRDPRPTQQNMSEQMRRWPRRAKTWPDGGRRPSFVQRARSRPEIPSAITTSRGVSGRQAILAKASARSSRLPSVTSAAASGRYFSSSCWGLQLQKPAAQARRIQRCASSARRRKPRCVSKQRANEMHRWSPPSCGKKLDRSTLTR